MKKGKRTYLFISILAAMLFTFIGFIAYGRGIYFPWSNIVLEDIADVAIDFEGNSYVLNTGGAELLRINPEGDVDLVLKGFGDAEGSFQRGLHVAVDDKGRIYIHNRIASEEAMSWIGGENIKVYDADGTYLYTACNNDYGVPRLKPSIIAMQNIRGDVFAFSTDERVVLVDDVSNGDISMYAYPGADKFINSACYDWQKDCVYATTLDGKIVQLNKNSYQILHSTPAEVKAFGALDDITVDENGTIVVCDVRSGMVSKLENNTLVPFFCPNKVTYDLDYRGGYIFNETYSIVRQQHGRYYSVAETQLGGWALLKSITVLLSALLVLVSLLYPGHQIITGIVHSKSRKVRLVAGLTVVVAILTVGFCTLVANEYSSIMRDELLERARLNAQLVDNLIDPEDFRNLDSVTDFGSPHYNRIKTIVDNVILDNGTLPGDMYLNLYTLGENGTVTVRYSLEETKGCNYPYIWSNGEEEAAVYRTGDTFKVNNMEDAEGNYICVYLPVEDEKGSVIGVVEAGTDMMIFRRTVQQRLLYFALSIVALAVVFILLALELIEFMDAKKGYSVQTGREGRALPPLRMYRIAVFMVFFITNITTPFLSIYALSLSDAYTTSLGIPVEILAAVPISAEVLFGAIFSMLGGGLIAKIGTRKAGVLGGMLFTVGMMIRFLYPDLMVLTVGNALQGAGWGIVLLIINSRIAAETDEHLQEQGFSNYNVALQNGINSGIVLGGFLLAFASYFAMLVCAAILSVALLLFVYFYIHDYQNEEKEEKEQEEVGSMSYLRYLLSPRVFVYFLCIVIPVIAASYYLNFLYPILGDNLGMSESMIGYSYLINGVVIICFGNLLVNILSKYFDRKILLLLASVLYLITFAVVGMFNNIPALLLSLVLLGVSDSFGYVAQSTFYTDLAETKAFGYEKAMGVYSLFENLAQSAGSFVFGYILSVGIKVGMTVYGVVIGTTGVIFVIVVFFCDKFGKKGGDMNNEN